MSVQNRKSKQRDRILELLRSERSHLSAVTVFDRLKTDFPSLSLGNVYRNLNILVEREEAVRLRINDVSDVFEAKREPHAHFICMTCGAVEDIRIPDELTVPIAAWAEQNTGASIRYPKIDLVGICPRCRATAGA